MRSQQEINCEINALRALKTPTGYQGHRTRLGILAQIEELEIGVDDTAEEWNEMLDSERDAVLEARRWKQGDSNKRPSQGWRGLVK